ncbi:MAG: hypothetical protein WCL11_02140 [Verrucomicrobiota bacterium]
MRTSLYEKGGGRMTGFFLANIILLLSTGFMIVAAQEALTVAAGGDKASIPEQAWSFLQTGKLSASARYRFELYERKQAAFPHTAEASTLRLALGYETPTVYGFSAFAEYEGVFVLGVDNYDVPGVPGQTKPGYPTILDPGANELNQGWVRWKWGETNFQATLTAGRQEIMLNDGRFLSISPWRQNHQSFDAAQVNLGLPACFGLSYAYLDKVHRVIGADAINGAPPMSSHLFDLRWKRKDQVNVSAYGLLLDYDPPSLFYQSTRTFGVRCTGPWKLNDDWGIYYTGEFANQQDFARNPNQVNANYWLGELGAVYQGHTLKAGLAWLGGRSATDKLSTPLAHPFNGWTELFASNPSQGTSHGLEAIYLGLGGPVSQQVGLTYTVTLYDYYAANDGAHYGRELDFGLAWKVKPVWDKWEIGTRFAYYWADTLFGNALRTSIYTSISF